MGKQHEQKTKILCGPRIHSVGSRDACPRIVAERRHYDAATWAAAILHAEQILLRGNAVRARNVAGKYQLTELVMQ